MKIKITRGTVIEGKARDVGEVCDINASVAKFIISLNKAVPYSEPIKAAKPKAPFQKKETGYKAPSGKTVKVKNKRKRRA